MSLASDIDDLKALGFGALSLVNAAILVAIVAVIVSTQAQTASVIKTFLAFVAWLVGQVVAPVSGGFNVALTSTPTPAGPIAASSSGATSSGGSSITGGQSIIPAGNLTGGTSGGTSGGTGGTAAGSNASLPPGWSATYQPGYTFGSTTLSTGQIVSGYLPPGT